MVAPVSFNLSSAALVAERHAAIRFTSGATLASLFVTSDPVAPVAPATKMDCGGGGGGGGGASASGSSAACASLPNPSSPPHSVPVVISVARDVCRRLVVI